MGSSIEPSSPRMTQSSGLTSKERWDMEAAYVFRFVTIVVKECKSYFIEYALRRLLKLST